MLKIQFYTRAECELCHAALRVVERVQQRLAFDLEIIDIDSHAELVQKYGEVIPVVAAGTTELARSFVEEKGLLTRLRQLSSVA